MVLGIDIGGTKIAAGLVTATGALKSSVTYPTETKKGRAAVLKNIKSAIARHLTKDVSAIGIGIAGQVDHRRGIFHGGPNLPKDFKNIKLVEIIKKEFHRPVFIDNDARCFTLAEAILGAGKKYQTVFGVTLGTGIGGGLSRGGKLIPGATDTAAEIGHMIIDFKNPPRCSCGQIGHLESAAGGLGLTRQYQRISGRAIDSLELEKLFKEGDEQAKTVVTEGALALAAGLANILTVVNPDCIVLGGGLTHFSDFVSLAKKQVPRLAPFDHLKKIPILKTRLGERAGVIGAALLASPTNHKPTSTS